MMRSIQATLLVVSSLTFGTHSGAAPCFKDALALGHQETEDFCNVWETQYRQASLLVTQRQVQRFVCDPGTMILCQLGMAHGLKEHFPLCVSLIRSGWSNSLGINASQAWQEWERTACQAYVP